MCTIKSCHVIHVCHVYIFFYSTTHLTLCMRILDLVLHVMYAYSNFSSFIIFHLFVTILIHWIWKSLGTRITNGSLSDMFLNHLNAHYIKSKRVSCVFICVMYTNLQMFWCYWCTCTIMTCDNTYIITCNKNTTEPNNNNKRQQWIHMHTWLQWTAFFYYLIFSWWYVRPILLCAEWYLHFLLLIASLISVCP